jgi:DNA-binding LacI/PurR family transcriptional regulator
MPETRVKTIADIARLAGVSKSTVSRALNDSPLIGVETKEQIQRIAREHRFERNEPARRLSLKKSDVVALVTYPHESAPASADPFLLEVMSGISAGLYAHRYDLLVIQQPAKDTAWIERYLDSGRVDGFIVLAATCTQRQMDALNDAGAPFVVWGRPSASGRFSSVTGDSLEGGRLATTHMLERGRERVAFLGGPAREPEVQQRYEGYATALREAGRELDPALVVHGSWSGPGAATAVKTLLEQAPALDGIFANSDLIAIGAMQELRARGRSVPGDVAVVGYDDVALAALASPPLTTIRQDPGLAGRLLAENLLQQIRTHAVTNVSIPAELVVRESA